MGKKVAACAQRSAKAVFLAYPVCVAQQRPSAPQGKHYRAEQIPQQLRRPGKGHGCDIFQQFSDRLQQTPQPMLQAASCADHGILGGKADGVQRLAHHRCYGIVQQLVPQLFPAVLTLAANPVPPQHAPALELRPQPSAASGGGAAVQAAQQAAAPLFYSSVNGIFLLPALLQGIFRPGTQQLDGVRSPVQKANRACTQYALFLLYTLHGLKQALT